MEQNRQEQSSDTFRVLVIHYSQTGQLTDLVDSLLAPLQDAPDIEIFSHLIEMEYPYPFPWSFFQFLDVLPDCVLPILPKIKECTIDTRQHYDLIILAYQVWFLSPSPPIAAFLASEDAQKLFSGQPVITLIGCRGMWIMAQEKVKKCLSTLGAILVGQIAVTDQGNALTSLITTPRWMLTGRKNAFWGIFPPAGIAAEDIKSTARFGEIIREGLQDGRIAAHDPILKDSGAVQVDPRFITSEKIGTRVFRFWAQLMYRAGPSGSIRRNLVISLFFIYFLFVLLIFIPLRMVLLFIAGPFLKKRFAALKKEYEKQ